MYFLVEPVTCEEAGTCFPGNIQYTSTISVYSSRCNILTVQNLTKVNETCQDKIGLKLSLTTKQQVIRPL